MCGISLPEPSFRRPTTQLSNSQNAWSSESSFASSLLLCLAVVDVVWKQSLVRRCCWTLEFLLLFSLHHFTYFYSRCWLLLLLLVRSLLWFLFGHNQRPTKWWRRREWNEPEKWKTKKKNCLLLLVSNNKNSTKIPETWVRWWRSRRNEIIPGGGATTAA